MRRATGVPEEWPSRLLALGQQAIQNPAYRPADTLKGARRKKPPGPRQFWHSRDMRRMREHHGEDRMLGAEGCGAPGVMLVDAALLGLSMAMLKR
jgi:hypothetical protein